MDKETRNKLRNTVVQCRKLLEEDVLDRLEGTFGIHRNGRIEDQSALPHLDEEGLEARRRAMAAVEHIQGYGVKAAGAIDQFQREVAFTHLNRLCAFKMLERRGLLEEAVSRGTNSNGFKVYLANHPDNERLWRTGDEYTAYKHFLFDVCARLSDEIKVLFDTEHVSSYLFPSRRALEGVLELINAEPLADIWDEDETIGWIYQYFTPKELREKARKESAAPRNSYELAFRNQFYTPRYVVQFLTDNTLGRTWYEMRKGETRLADQCEYMVRRPTEIFLEPGEEPPPEPEHDGDLSQEELLKQPVHVRHRDKKLPWEIKVLDPASGSGHFLLYAFDLLETIYEEAYDDPDIGQRVRGQYPNRDEYQASIPAMILRHNLHGIDIDLRSTQIAALALWMRAQRSYQRLGLNGEGRPRIERTNIVCAEPMPGDEALLDEFCDGLQPSLLGDLVRQVWEKMKLAGEAGSLLKIEEEIRDVVRRAQEAWRKAPKGYKISLFDGTVQRPAEQKEFDFSEVTGAEFWQKAEGLLLDAMERFSGRATNGRSYGRRLFRDDAEQGFAFIDLCRERHDVVLMNPPFGKCSKDGAAYFESEYGAFKSDIGIAFVDRFLRLLQPTGCVGAITSRAFLASDSLDKWREERLLTETPINSILDLGYGVLDDAMVEAAVCVIDATSMSDAPHAFIRALESRDKESAVHRFLQSGDLGNDLLFFLHDLADFKIVPLSVICYWLPKSILEKLRKLPTLQASGGAARHGLVTTDDWRFLRLTWEVPVTAIDSCATRWRLLAKGGEYQPFWDDFHLCVDWSDDGDQLKAFLAEKRLMTQGSADWSPWLNHSEYYGLEGLTYPERTTSDFCPRVLPEGVIFSSTGQAIQFASSHDGALAYLCGAFTRFYKLVVESFVGSGDNAFPGSAAKHYRSGLLNQLPAPLQDSSTEVEQIANEGIAFGKNLYAQDETARNFCPARRLQSLRYLASCAQHASLDGAVRVIAGNSAIEALVSERFDLTGGELAVLDEIIGPHPQSYSGAGPADGNIITRLWTKPVAEVVEFCIRRHGPRRQLTKKSFIAHRKLELICHGLKLPPENVVQVIKSAEDCLDPESYYDSAAAEISYCLGSVFGRWDVRIALDPTLASALQDPFDPLPVCSPGMLVGPDAIPARPGGIASEEWMRARPNAITLPPEGSASRPTIPDNEYPLRVDWDGILVDDPDHQDDIVRRAREVLEVLWKDRAEAIEQEACDILGVKSLREYFGNSKHFWESHVKRYSKSRRKAPIYWLLQSPSRRYALWLYYHRLNRDMLYKALRNYVDPKHRREESHLKELRDRLPATPEGRERKALEKQIDDQETIVNDVLDLRERLEKVAQMGLDPDLNDGVILNIAPLHELVPWKEPKQYWDDLLAGKYEWSAIGKQLRERGLVRRG